MAITVTELTSGADTASSDTYATASVTPGANKLILACIAWSASSDIGPPALSGNGLTWVLEDQVVESATGNRELAIFRAMGASPSAGAVTIDPPSADVTGLTWAIYEVGGVDTSGTNGSGAVRQSEVNSSASATSLTVTLAAFGSANNGTFGFFAFPSSVGVWTPGSGFTGLSTDSYSTPAHMSFAEWRDDNDTTVDASHNQSATAIGGIALELVAPSAAVTQVVMVTGGS
jgi:hypothetical protein